MNNTKTAVFGKCVEAGDDSTGQPRITVHADRGSLFNASGNIVFKEVAIVPADEFKKLLADSESFHDFVGIATTHMTEKIDYLRKEIERLQRVEQAARDLVETSRGGGPFSHTRLNGLRDALKEGQ
jgi:hypothetical protein